MNPQEPAVVHEPDHKRFRLQIGSHTAYTEYIRAGNRIVFSHTEVPPPLEGQGVASRLARTALDYARAEGLRVMPLCPFVAGFIRRHPEYKDLLQAGFRVD